MELHLEPNEYEEAPKEMSQYRLEGASPPGFPFHKNRLEERPKGKDQRGGRAEHVDRGMQSIHKYAGASQERQE